MQEQNPRMTGGLSAVCHRAEKRPFFLAPDQWTGAFVSLETLFMSEFGITKNNVLNLLDRANLKLF